MTRALLILAICLLAACSPRTSYECTGDPDPGYNCDAWTR